jgi:hypothetical protein
MGHEDLFRQRWLHANCLFRLADPRREARYPARGAGSRRSRGRERAAGIDPTEALAAISCGYVVPTPIR